MRVLSAAEALTPALERTKAMLTPYSFRLWFKLGLVSLLAQTGAQFIAPPVGNLNHSAAAPPSLGSNTLLVLAVVGSLFFLLGLALLYFGSRMQFVLMELVAVRSTAVGPSWRKHGSRTWPWIGLKLLCYLAAMVVVGAIVALPLLHFFHSLPVGAQPATATLLGNVALVFGVVLLAVLLLMLVMWTLRDFVLPFLLFEDAKLGGAVRAATALIRREPGNVALYFLLKIAFSLAIGMALQLCILVSLLVIGLPGGLLAGLFWLVMRHTDASGHLLMYTGCGLIGVVSFTAWMALIVCLVGATLVFYQAYALYFLGGRIPNLGNLLESSTPPRVDPLGA